MQARPAIPQYLILRDESHLEAARSIFGDRRKCISALQASNGSRNELDGADVLIWGTPDHQHIQWDRALALELAPDCARVRMFDMTQPTANMMTAPEAVKSKWNYDALSAAAQTLGFILTIEKPPAPEAEPTNVGSPPVPSLTDGGKQLPQDSGPVLPSLPGDEFAGEPAPMPEILPIEAYQDESTHVSRETTQPDHWEKPFAAVRAVPIGEWPEPINAWDSSDTSRLPQVREEWLPEAIAPYVFDQGERGGVDINQPALSCLWACSAVIRAGIGVQMQQDMGDGGRVWTEYPVLWGAILGLFSEKKGLGQDIGTDFLKDMDREQRLEDEELWKVYGRKEKVYENQMRSYYAEQAKTAGEIPVPEAPVKPDRNRLWTDDATLEALGKLFTENPRGKVAVIKDELSGWFGSFDAYSNGKADKDRPTYLSGYESKERLIDRVAGGFYHVRRWGVPIMGGIQPDVVSRIAAKLGGDGMLQRFQIISSKPAKQVPRRPADTAATKQWLKVQRNLFHMQARGNPVTLSREAAEFMDEKVLWVNKALNSGLTPALAGHIGKWEGLFGRLAITSHCIEDAARCKLDLDALKAGNFVPSPEISYQTMQQVWGWMQGLIWPHAVHFYTSTMDQSDSNKHLLAFANFVIARKLEFVRPGYLGSEWTHYKREIKTIQQRKEFWDSVVNAGIAAPADLPDRTLLVAKKYVINPKFLDGRFESFAAIAAQQKERYKEIMPESWKNRG